MLHKATWSQSLQDGFEDINYVLNKVEWRRKTPPPPRGTAYKVAVPLSPKPSNSPEVKNWEQLNGKVHYYSDGTWEYEDWEGNKVKYIDGFPDVRNKEEAGNGLRTQPALRHLKLVQR